MTISLKRKIAIGYIRVSSKKQADGQSLEAQETRIRAWCVAHGHDLRRIHMDDESGKDIVHRPGLRDALDEVCVCGGVLVVTKLDRMTRKVRDACAISERLEEFGADLAVMDLGVDTSSATGRLFFNIVAAFAEFERLRISERQVEAVERHKAAGILYGVEPPYGQMARPTGVLEPCETELRVIARMRVLRAEGLSYAGIALRLTAEGIKTRHNKCWWPGTVRKALKCAVEPQDAA